MSRQRKHTMESLETIRAERPLSKSEYQALWTLRNPKRAAEIAKKTYEKNYAKNAEKILERNRKWVEDNRAQHNKTKREYQTRRRAELRAMKEAYAASPEGLAKAAAKKEDRKRRDRENSSRWRATNLEKAKEIDARNRVKFRKKRIAQAAAWRAANCEHVQAYQVEYEANRKETRPALRRAQYATNPTPHRERSKAFAKAHPEYKRAQKAKRRAWKLAAGGTHSSADEQKQFDKQGGLCANPFCTADLTVVQKHLDHIKPLSRGGSNAAANLQFLCAPCNQRKTNFDSEKWLEREAERAAAALGATIDEVREAFVCQVPAPVIECAQS